MRRLVRLLLASAGTTARLADGAASLVRCDVSVVGLHGVRVARMHGLVCRLVQLLLAKVVLNSTDAPLTRFKGYFVTATLILVPGCGHAGCRATAELLVMELQGHTIIMLLATLL